MSSWDICLCNKGGDGALVATFKDRKISTDSQLEEPVWNVE